jgi:hypothetical protein
VLFVTTFLFSIEKEEMDSNGVFLVLSFPFYPFNKMAAFYLWGVRDLSISTLIFDENLYGEILE